MMSLPTRTEKKSEKFMKTVSMMKGKCARSSSFVSIVLENTMLLKFPIILLCGICTPLGSITPTLWKNLKYTATGTAAQEFKGLTVPFWT